MWWFRGGSVLHRNEDKPVIEMGDGTLMWYQHNTLHRSGNKPAIMFTNGQHEWWTSGGLNRVTVVTEFHANSCRAAFVKWCLG